MLLTIKVNKLPEWNVFICNFNAVFDENFLEHCGQATLHHN